MIFNKLIIIFLISWYFLFESEDNLKSCKFADIIDIFVLNVVVEFEV